MNDKQKRFCEEYLIDLNATQAAIRAGYSENAARQMGSDLLSHPAVQEEITRLKLERSETTGVNAAWLLTRLAHEAEADVADLYDESGALKPVREWPKIWRLGLVAGLDVEEIELDGIKVGSVKKIRVSDRIKRLELIGKHISVQAFQERVKHEGLEGLADRLARAAERLKGDENAG